MVNNIEKSMLLDNKFLRLEVMKHLSANTHYTGYLHENNKKVFIKKFNKVNRFNTELNILRKYCPDRIVDYFSLDKEYVLVLTFEEYTHIELKEEVDIKRAALLLADFHRKLSREQGIELEKEIPTISARIDERMKQLKDHIKFEEMSVIFLKVSKGFEELDEEFLNPELSQIIHGDFGERNIVIDEGGEGCLIDFERGRFDNVWMEFVKIFEFELISEERKDIFLEEYLTSRYIKKISKELYIALVFLETLSIYHYCSKVNDYEFSKKADYLLAKIRKDLGV